MNKKLKIGDPVITHKFTSIPGCPWCEFMEPYDGAHGVITEVEERYVGVEFADTDMYSFPHSAVEPVYSLEKQFQFKRGDHVRVRKFEHTGKVGRVTGLNRINREDYYHVLLADGSEPLLPDDAITIEPDTITAPEKRGPFKLGEKVIARKFESTRYLVWGDSLEKFVGKPATIGREMDNDGDYGLLFDGGIHRYFPASAVFPFAEAPAVVEIKRDRVMPDGSHVTMRSTDGSNWSECDDSELVVTRRGFPLGGVPEPFVSPTRVERVIDLDDTITRGDRMGMNNHTCVYSSSETPYENPHALAEWLRKPLTHGKGNRS